MITKNSYKIIISFITLLLVLFLANTTTYKQIENQIYDNFIFSNLSNSEQKQISIIKIDDESIKKLGMWPWDRKYHADLINILTKDQAKVIAFNLDFENKTNPESDEALISAAKNRPVISLATNNNPFEFTRDKYIAKLRSAFSLANDKILISSDGVVRKADLKFYKMPSFSLAVPLMYRSPDYVSRNDRTYIYKKAAKISSNPFLINFKHREEFFKSYSYSKIINRNFNSGIFKGKIVLIGISDSRLTAFFQTPVSKKTSISGDTSPVFLQAQIIDSILNYKNIKVIDKLLYPVLIILFVFLMVVFFRDTWFIRQSLVLIVFIPVVIYVLSMVLFSVYGLWFSPLAFIIASILVFILLLVSQYFKINLVLDGYLADLTNKSAIKEEINSQFSLDTKLDQIKKITGLIQKDKELFDIILSSANNVILLFDNNGKVLYTNSNRKTFNLYDCMQEICIDLISDKIKNNGIYKQQVTYKDKYFEFIATRAKENLFVGVFNDVTSVVKINEMKSTVLRMLSHEMKTPLSTILLCSDFLQRHVEGDRNIQYIEKICYQTEFLNEIINHLLELNRLELPDFVLDKELIDIENTISTVIEDLSILAKTKSIEINYEITKENQQTLMADRKYLTIMLKNLVNNAIKYSPEGSRVDIKIHSVSREVKISVKDYGIGMSEDELTRLFERFYRAKNEHTAKIPGTGLGLSIVKKIIDLHKGEIIVNSKPGEGSEFILTLTE